MIFNFTAGTGFDFMTSFAQHLNVAIEDNRMLIPNGLGKGYVARFAFGPYFKITIHSYRLKEDLVIKRNASKGQHDLITIFFYNNEQALDIAYSNHSEISFSQKNEAAVQLTSNDLSSTIRFPAHYQIQYVVVAIRPDYLKALLELTKPNAIIDTIATPGRSFLYFESITADAKLLLKNITALNMSDHLSQFFMHIKVQELLYIMFQKLLHRQNAEQKNITSADAERLLFVRNELITDLSEPPVLSELARLAAMSETKLKQLFKQTFGDTIYNYFQNARMEEAAFLLKQHTHSVAEVGYELGFTNLSHFSRVFEKRYGVTPKRYSSQF